MVQELTHQDKLLLNTVRVLAADITKKPNSGHPGAPMGCAPMAVALWSRFIKCNPKNPYWINRDRFVLSNGHGCALQYTMLHLLGYDVTMEDLQSFRALDSKTPGHPENTHTPGIEVTTGPLGQGIANAVGLAIAEEHLAATFNKEGFELFNNYTYCILGDGCMQEGVASEACSLAGHLKLGKLIALYDDNHISIDGDTALGFTEDVVQRYQSYGWHTLIVEDGDTDLAGIIKAIEEAKKVTDKPSLIKIRTTIGYGSEKQGTEGVHGNALADDDIVNIKKKFGFDPEVKFHVDRSVYDYWKKIADQGAQYEKEWINLFAEYSRKYPKEAEDLTRRLANKLPSGWKDALPRYKPSDKAVATRKLSQEAITALTRVLPELVGGSADLTPSTNTDWKGSLDFQHPSTGLGDFSGKYFRFGVREHGMSAILNGMAAYGCIIPFGATFFNFITYAWGAVRLSAVSHRRVIYVMTHDSIGLGEDGPTHQPIETMALCRACPNLITIRPADGNETSGAWAVAIENTDRPTVLVLSRQNLPQIEGSSLDHVRYGAYKIGDVKNAKLAIVATGSEVSLAVQAAEKLSAAGIATQVISMPSWELFEEQSSEYKNSIFPIGVPTLSIEALSEFGWSRYSHAHVGMKTFGVSASGNAALKKFGFTVDNVEQVAKKLVGRYEGKEAPALPIHFD